jgi:hypothetical protein
MTIHSPGHAPDRTSVQQSEEEYCLLIEHVDVILKHEEDILQCTDYFFVPLSFAWCSWPYIGGDGPMCLGHLLLGWKDGILTEPCSACGGNVLVVRFSGSPLSGTNSWAGYCINCRDKKLGRQSVHKPFFKRVEFVLNLRNNLPEQISEWEEYEGFNFSWGGTGLQPALKKRLVWKSPASPVSLETLIEGLASATNAKSSE